MSSVCFVEESKEDWERGVDVGDLRLWWKSWVRRLCLAGLGADFCLCWVEIVESQEDRSGGCVSIEVGLKPQYDFSRKKNAFCRTPNSSGNTESRYLN